MKFYPGKIILSILKTKSPKTLVCLLATYTILFVYSHFFKLCKFIVGQHKQNKSEKATQSTNICTTNHQQQNVLGPYQQAFQFIKNIKHL